MKKLYVIAGPAASGKSKFAQVLANELNCDWLDFDDDIDSLIAENQSLITEIGMEAFLNRMREERYKNLIEKSLKVLNTGNSLIISAPFTEEVGSQDKWNLRFESITDLGIKPVLCWIATDPAVRKERMNARAALRDIEKTESYKFEPITPVVSHILINGAADFKAQVLHLLIKGNK